MDLASRCKKIVFPLLTVALVNFFLFAAVATYVGGDVINGKSNNGHYYLSSHGKMTEVSRALYIYSVIHATSVFVTHAAFFIIAGYLHYTGEIRLCPIWRPFRPDPP